MTDNDIVGEIHILIRPPDDEQRKNRIEISTSFNQADMNLMLDHIKKLIIDGELTLDSQ